MRLFPNTVVWINPRPYEELLTATAQGRASCNARLV